MDPILELFSSLYNVTRYIIFIWFHSTCEAQIEYQEHLQRQKDKEEKKVPSNPEAKKHNPVIISLKLFYF